MGRGNKLSLGQVVVPEKSNEIAAIPELLDLLDVSGALITIDAIGCQKEIADRIRQGGGDYLLTVKDNQPKLRELVEKAIDSASEKDALDLDEPRTVERGHGRRETRNYTVVAAPESVDPEELWRDLRAVGITISERKDSQGRASIETRYYTSVACCRSKNSPARAFLESPRIDSPNPSPTRSIPVGRV